MRAPTRAARARTALLAGALLAGVALTGCGASSSEQPAPSGSSTSQEPTASPDTRVAPVDWTSGAPEVSGGFGQAPTVTFTSDDPPSVLSRSVLVDGDGPQVQEGDLIAVDYIGQIYGGKVFNNSYESGGPATFPIGVGQVVPGWDNTLVGMKVGSRVLIGLPPDQGYGASGNAQIGVTGTDTLVFVVDIAATYPVGAGGQADAKPEGAVPQGISVTGELGAEPSLSVESGTAAPSKVVTTVLGRGSGAALTEGLTVLQYVAVGWESATPESTWTSEPLAVQVSADPDSSPFASLVGVPIGSRVLLQLPGGASGEAYAVVVDIVDSVPSAAQAAAR